MCALEIRHLTKTIGSAIIDDISFSVADGEFFVILGPSGSGKSTLLKLILGLEKPDSGSIWIDGMNVTSLPPQQRNLGMVFQDYGLYPHMNVAQNIAYGLEARHMDRAEIERRTQQAAGMLRLETLLDRAIADLSGGEQQRVALARALAKDAAAFLFDEPLSNLDPKLRHQARRDILRVHTQKNKPSIYVTHDQTEAFALANRIALLVHGKLMQVGSPQELLDHPANTFAATFIGSPPSGILRAAVRSQEDKLLLDLGAVTLPLPTAYLAAMRRYERPDILVGLRPTALALAPLDHEKCPAINAEITWIEPLLGESILGLKLSENASVTALVPDDVALSPGDRVTVFIDLERITLFDSVTEQALPAGNYEA